ncbi:MAG TPA: MFS transporter, partial [Jatrophihabitans sp.]|nr:MFS transporter [Jatrophihabitans sp.]
MSRPQREPPVLGTLCAGFFLIDFDLVVINPLLLPISHHFGVSLGAATFALTGYLLLFGIMQPVHGIVSDAIGRIRVLRLALLGLAGGNLIAALAPNLAVLIAGRAVAGAFGAAIIPVTMAYVGDRIAAPNRQRTMAVLMSCSALGAAAATICAGVLTDLVSWRPAIGLVAVAAPVLAARYGRLPEAGPADWAHQPSAVSRIHRVLGEGWLRFLIGFTFVEGAAMVGFFNFFNAALQVHGKSILVAGLVTSSYGLAAVTGGLAVRLLDTRLSGTAMFGGGMTLLLLGYLVAAGGQGIGAILLASVLAGSALAVAQSALQAWVLAATPPEVRGTAASLIACSVFTGAAVSTAVVGGLAGHGDFGTLFGVAAVVTLVVAVVGTLAR